MFGRLHTALSSSSRLPLSVAATARNANIYRIRFVEAREKNSLSARVFYVLAASTLGLISYQLSVGLSGQPLFLPLEPPRRQPVQKYKRTDAPVVRFLKFCDNPVESKKAKNMFMEIVLEIVRQTFPDAKGQLRPSGTMLYFHFPKEPLAEFTQRGIMLTYRPPNRAANPQEGEGGGGEEGERGRGLGIGVGFHTKTWDYHQYQKRSSILYPRWMYNALQRSLSSVWKDITREPEEDEEGIEDLMDLVQYGVDISAWTVLNTRETLRKSKPKLPPPNSHIFVDGVVQVVSGDMLVVIDITGSFNPDNTREYKVHRAGVRFAARLRQQRDRMLREQMQNMSKTVGGAGGRLGEGRPDRETVRAASKAHDEMFGMEKALPEGKPSAAVSRIVAEEMAQRAVRTQKESEKKEKENEENDRDERLQHEPRGRGCRTNTQGYRSLPSRVDATSISSSTTR
jgi:hypothetical protein